MEALLIIIGELVFAILAPFFALIVELFASIVGFVFSFRRGEPTSTKKPSRVPAMVAKVMLALAAVLLVILWVINSFYFNEAVERVFVAAKNRSDVSIACDGIDGSLFSGQVDLRSCTVERSAHPKSNFDLRVEEVSIDLNILSLLGTASVDTARIVGLSGSVETNREMHGDAKKYKKDRPRRAFEIEDLSIANLDLALSGINPDGAVFELPVVVDELTSQPLRSRLALFDILFRSNASGSIAGAPFVIETSVIEGGRQTKWRATKLPVASFGAMTGGAMAWFSSGTVDVSVDDQWDREDGLDIDMAWRLQFVGVEVTAPSGTSSFVRRAAGPITRFVNSKDGEFPLEFQMVVNENQFEFHSSLATMGLWSAVGASVNNVLGRFGIDKERAAETGNAIKEGAKSVLDRLRKPKDDADSEE